MDRRGQAGTHRASREGRYCRHRVLLRRPGGESSAGRQGTEVRPYRTTQRPSWRLPGHLPRQRSGSAHQRRRDRTSLRRLPSTVSIRTWIVRSCAYLPGMAIARFPSIVVDCPDPSALATFYGAMLDWKVNVSSDWAEVRADYGRCISFQQVEAYTPPRWPTPGGAAAGASRRDRR